MKPLDPAFLVLALVSSVLALALAVVAVRVSSREAIVCRCEVEVRP